MNADVVHLPYPLQARPRENAALSAREGDEQMPDRGEIDGVDARRIIGAEIEPMGEHVRLVVETAEGAEFVVRLPAEEFEVALPQLLTLPGRARAAADPIGSPPPAPGAPGRARVISVGAAVFRTNTSNGDVLFELHIGWPLYPVFFSFPRKNARELVEAAARALSEPAGEP